jgi:exodeoxyribonuclease VII small subunit
VNQVSFEEALKELETIVEQLERGQASLDDALRLWERGEDLHRVCLARLDAAQGRVETLAARVREAEPGPQV